MTLYDIAKEIVHLAYWDGQVNRLDSNWFRSNLSNKTVRIRFNRRCPMTRLDGRGWMIDIRRAKKVIQTRGNRDRMMEDLLLFKLSR